MSSICRERWLKKGPAEATKDRGGGGEGGEAVDGAVSDERGDGRGAHLGPTTHPRLGKGDPCEQRWKLKGEIHNIVYSVEKMNRVMEINGPWS